jgi:hypothetical protein
MTVVASLFACKIVSFLPTGLRWRWNVDDWEKPEFPRSPVAKLQAALARG